MMKTLALLLLLTTVHAQGSSPIIFPGEEIEGFPAAAGEGGAEDDALNTEFLDALEVSTRQGSPFSSSDLCVTPNGQRGICQSFVSCPAYQSLRSILNRPSVLSFLRGRICRRTRRSIALCCPSSNSVPAPAPAPTPSRPVSTNPFFQQECGNTPLVSRIIGGEFTEPGEWPWMAALGLRIGNSFTSICAGALITRKHVLSAEHCFKPKFNNTLIPTMARLGAYELSRNSVPVPPQDFNIRDRRHGGYNIVTQENDIIVLVLDREATFNDYVQPACLPFNYRNNDFVGEHLVVTGWGRTQAHDVRTSDVLLKAIVPVKSTASCIRDYRRLEASRRPTIDDRSLCAGVGGKDACAGDSGGPLHYLDLDESKYYVVGIVSFGVGCGRAEYPGVYTRVTKFLSWIERNAV